MSDSRTLSIILKAKDQTSGEIKKVNNSLGVMEKSAKSSFSTITKGLITAGLGFASFRAIKNAIVDVSEFEQSMSNISTLIDTNTESLESMTNEVLRMSKEIPFSAKELSEGLYQIRSAGISAEDSMNILYKSSKLAVAGLSSISEAVNISTSAINSWKLTGGDANNIFNSLFLAVKNGKTTVSELSKGFGQVAGLASNAGIGLNEFLSATSALTTTGQSASIAYTQLRASINSIQAPTEEMKKLFDKAGISSGQLELKNNGLVETMKKINGVANGNAESLKKAYGSVEAMNAGISLADNLYQQFTDTLNEMNTDTEALGKAFEKQSETIQNQTKLIGNKFFVLKQKAVQAFGPMINYLMDAVGNFLDWFMGGMKLLPDYFAYIGNSISSKMKIALLNVSKMVQTFLNFTAKGVSKLVEFFGGNPIKVPFDIESIQNELDYVKTSSEITRDILVENLGNATREMSASFVSFSDSVALTTLKQTLLNEVVDDSSGNIKDLSKNVLKLKESYDDMVNSTIENLTELQNKIKDLRTENGKLLSDQLQNNKETAKSIGEAYIEQEDKLKGLTDSSKDLRSKLKEFEGKLLTDSEKEQKEALELELSELNEIITKENTALIQFNKEKNKYIEEITEARRRANLTDFERTIENLNRKKQAQIEETLSAIAENNKQIEIERNKATAIQKLAMETKDVYISQLQELTSMNEIEIDKQIEKYKELQDTINNISSGKVSVSSGSTGSNGNGDTANAGRFGFSDRSESSEFYRDIDVALELDTWYHIVATKDSSEVIIYVDGVERASTAFSGHTPDSGNVVIGNKNSYDYAPDGETSGAKLYNRALSADEVKLLYEKGR